MVQYLHFRILKFPLIFASWQPFTTTSSCWSTGRRKSTSTLRWPSQNASGIGRRRQLGLGSLGSCRLRNPGWFGLHLWYLESFLYFFSLKHQWFSNIFCKTGTPEWSRLGIINPGLTSWNIIVLFVDLQKWPTLESADKKKEAFFLPAFDGPFTDHVPFSSFSFNRSTSGWSWRRSVSKDIPEGVTFMFNELTQWGPWSCLECYEQCETGGEPHRWQCIEAFFHSILPNIAKLIYPWVLHVYECFHEA